MIGQSVALFFGGVVLANAMPHLVAGVQGRPLPTPFAKPPFRGLSSPAVNILWGLTNLVVAYVLLVVVARFELRQVGQVAIATAGFGLGALAIARSMTRMQRARDGS